MTRGLGLMFYGDGGIGKTAFAAQLPKPCAFYSPHEYGYDDLDLVGEIPAGCTNQHPGTYEELIKNLMACEARTAVIDNLTTFKQVFYQYVCDKYFSSNMMSFNSFSQGPDKTCPQLFPQFLSVLELMRNKGIHVILLAHRTTESETNGMGADIITEEIEFPAKMRAMLKTKMQGIIYMGKQSSISQGTKTIGKHDNMQIVEGKAGLDTTRLMYCTTAGSHQAKSRGLGLPPVVSMGKTPQEAYMNFYNGLHPNLQKLLQVQPSS